MYARGQNGKITVGHIEQPPYMKGMFRGCMMKVGGAAAAAKVLPYSRGWGFWYVCGYSVDAEHTEQTTDHY